MIKRVFKFSSAAALLFAGLASAPTPAAAGGCGYDDCAEPAPVVLYQSNCGCGGGSYYYGYAPAYAYPSAYAGYAAYGGYGYAGYGYGGYGYGGGYGYAGAAYRAAVSPYRYANRFYRPRGYVGARRGWR